jgi:hypothetical protein
MGACAEYVQRKFGVRTRAVTNPLGDLDIGSSYSQVLLANPDRLASLVMNLGAYNVYVGFDRDVSSTKGILLVANGGLLSLVVDDDLELVTYPVYAVCPGGTSRVYVVETEAS